MKHRAMLVLAPVLFATCLPFHATVRAGDAAPKALEAWLPDDVIGYAKINHLGERLSEFLGSQFRRDLESLGLVRVLLQNEKWQQFQDQLKKFKDASGKEPLSVFQSLLGREVVIAARPGSGEPEVALITRASSAEDLESGLKAIQEAIKAQVGYAISPNESTYKDRTIQAYGEALTVKLGSVFVVARGRAILEKVIDLAAGESKVSVAASPLYQKARASGKELVSLSIQPKFIPNYHLPEKVDNAVGSLLISGFLGALEKCELLSASLTVGEGKAALDLSSSLSKDGMADKYKSFFPEVAGGSLRERLEKRGILAYTELHRNLAQWWEKREDLLIPRAAGELAGFEQIMSGVVFQGRNFQDEVLPEFGPTITLVARNQEYADLGKRPKPAIPSFAIVFELKSADKFAKGVTAGFQSLVGIINADQGQKKKGMMPMLVETEKVGDSKLYAVSQDLPQDGEPGMVYNFSPSMAVVGSRLMISSTRELGRILVEEIAAAGTASAPRKVVPDVLRIDGPAVKAILDENRELIIADNMMKKGTSKEQAEAEMGGLLETLKLVRDLSMETGREGDAVNLRILLRTKSAGGATAASEPAGAGKGASF